MPYNIFAKMLPCLEVDSAVWHCEPQPSLLIRQNTFLLSRKCYRSWILIFKKKYSALQCDTTDFKIIKQKGWNSIFLFFVRGHRRLQLIYELHCPGHIMNNPAIFFRLERSKLWCRNDNQPHAINNNENLDVISLEMVQGCVCKNYIWSCDN